MHDTDKGAPEMSLAENLENHLRETHNLPDEFGNAKGVQTFRITVDEYQRLNKEQ